MTRYDIIFGKGISWESCLLEAGIEKNLVEKKGAWRGASAFGLGFRKQVRGVVGFGEAKGVVASSSFEVEMVV